MPDQASRTDPALELAVQAALLLENGQTTEGARHAVAHIGEAYGTSLSLLAAWRQLTVLSTDDSATVQAAATPVGDRE